jgi:hypothetical protein
MSSKPSPVLFSEESASVQAHLQILQNVIQRMAFNSTSCKSWCITLVSAILVLIADKGKPELAGLALIPSLLFLGLDAYYLALEKAFRASYNNFVRKLHYDQINVEDIYSVIPRDEMLTHELDALKSFSVWGFYGTLISMVAIARAVVLK